MKFAVIISSSDPETVWNAFRFANTAMTYEDQVDVFLLGKGVEALAVTTLTYDTGEQIDIFRSQGGKMIGCGVCCESREDLMPNLKESLNCDIGSMQQLYQLVAEADKVLTF